MPRHEPYARIAITLPQKDLDSADRLAKALDRSRSWVVAEAVRRYASHAGFAHPTAPTTADAKGARAEPTTPGLGAQRQAQLIMDLALTHEARVRAAEETLQLTESRRPARTHVLRAFDRYEDFLDYKRTRDIGG